MYYIEKIDSNNNFKWRYTPWDEKIFEKKTMEIIDISFSDIDILKKFFLKINKIIESERIEIVFLRFNSFNQLFKKEALINGFQIVEHSYYVEHSNIRKINQNSKRLNFREPTLEDLPQILKIVKESFEHGRFHEDPFVDASLAKKRYENWIPDLIKETNFFVFDIKGEVAGFFNYVIKDTIIDLPLSGVNSKFAGLGGVMWNEMFSMISEKEEIKKVKIMISASNLAVLNLYTKLGFKVTESLFGYHKHISEN